MKERTSKVGGMLEKLGLAKGAEVKIQWPENLQEVRQIMGKLKINGVEIDMTPERFISYAWRGFTLSFQGPGEALSEEEKAIRKTARKKENAVIKALRVQAGKANMTLEAFCKSKGLEIGELA